ncbi:MAG: hypothetical protein EXX96DRAFT_623306 [Benjaminiella poitrasii]|nr:MAG: hypothetical protein EXX96DRAFT_623306 [Benjaminiella poitrasii]
MSNSPTNVTSSSASSQPPTTTTTYGTSMIRSGSNRSFFIESNRKSGPRSRQNTAGLDFTGEDLTRSIGSDYQEIQIRTLTKWVNAQLKKVGESIGNIHTDLRDGKKLLKLLSVISNEPAPKPERMNMRIHQLSNVAQALDFLEKHVGSDNMPDIGNEAIVNGDAKKTLALIFFIMLKYQIQLIVLEHGDKFMQSLSELSEHENGVISQPSDLTVDVSKASAPNTPLPLASSRKVGGSQHSIADKLQHASTSAEAKVALLYWVRIQLEDYIAANIIPSIQDFSRSWRTGVAFCLLIHRHNPAYIPDLFSVHLHEDLSEKATWCHLLKLAFDLAAEKLGVEAYLEPEDLVNVDYPHEPSVMMYVSEFYKVISKYQREEPVTVKCERAAKRKAAIVMATGGTDPLKEDHSGVLHHDGLRRSSSPTPVLEDNSKVDQQQDGNPEPEYRHQTLPVVTTVPSVAGHKQKKRMAHRESTLNESDKARIKADLNDKLLMQLTGYLPHGVHPTLDELLIIHDTMLSFIKSNTQTIDEIPEEFEDSSAVFEYIEALGIIEEHVQVEARHLEIAKIAHDVLTAPPEDVNNTVIHLTDLQRTQVSKLYNMLEKEWLEFVELLRVTKDDLKVIEKALVDNEERAEVYRERAVDLEADLDLLKEALSHIAPLSSPSPALDDEISSEKTNDSSFSFRLHPLGGSQMNADVYQKQLTLFIEKFDAFQNSSWKDFKATENQLSRSVKQAVTVVTDRVMKKYEALVEDLQKEQKSCRDFQRGLVIAKIIREIESELETIQSVMGNSRNSEKATTDDRIQMLESRVSAVQSTIHSLKEEFGDLLEHDGRFIELFSGIQAKYESVNEWVDQVRVWFIEAERIREWIEYRIETLHKHNDKSQVDPLSPDFSPQEWNDERTHIMYEEHDRLTREIERFNKDDMARLRSHVRVLTSNTDRSLSPADASTIEITLMTLTILDRLMNILRERSNLVKTLRARTLWENLMVDSLQWCQQMEEEIVQFMSTKARWSEPREDESASVHVKQNVEEVIQILVSFENAIAEFDKGSYSAVLDAYQEMEDLEGSLPHHLEERQVQLEQQFERIMKRCAFTRKIVEQHLIVNDVTVQFRKLRSEGEKLKSAMAQSNDASFNTTDSSTFSERVQMFKDSASHWVTSSLKRIPYNESPENLYDFCETNEEENTRIYNQMNEYSIYLAEITEDLEELLLSHRENLSLQQRASIAYDDMLRITAWIQERLRTLQRFDSTILYGKDIVTLEDENLDRLEKEQEGISVRLQHIESHDMKKALNVVRLLETEIDKSNSISIDRNALISAIEDLEHKHDVLKTTLEIRVHEVSILRKRVVWETQWEEARQSIHALVPRIWDFYSKYAQYDTEGLKKRASGESITTEYNQVDKDSIFFELLDQVQELETKLPILQTKSIAYEEFENAYALYNCHSTTITKLPDHINSKKKLIETEYQHLKLLLDYVHHVMKQHDDISLFVNSCSQVLVDGEQTMEIIQGLLRGSIFNTKSTTNSTTTSTTTLSADDASGDQHPNQPIDTLMSVKSQIHQLCKQGEDFQYIDGSNWFESLQQQILIEPKDYNLQIKQLINNKIAALTKMDDSIKCLLALYLYVDTIKSKFYKLQSDSAHIQQWIDGATLALNAFPIDVAATTFDLSFQKLSSSRSENTRLLSEFHQTEATLVKNFQAEVEQLVEEATQNTNADIEDIVKACKSLSENILRGMATLLQSINTQILVLNAAEKRTEWETEMKADRCRVDTLNRQIQQYILRKNKCVAQQDNISKNAIQELVTERMHIYNQYVSLKADRLPNLKISYEHTETLFVKLPLIKSIPIHMKERMESIVRSIQKLEDTLLWREKELDYIQQRCHLELEIKQHIDELEQYRKIINSFIEKKGRWVSNGDDNIKQQQEIKEASDELLMLRRNFDDFKCTMLAKVKQQHQYLQEASASMNPGFMSELHRKKIETLGQLERAVEADLCFAHKVILQKEQVTIFLSESTEVEKEAEIIRALMLSIVPNPTLSVSELTTRLECFTVKVEELKSFSGNELLSPKRLNNDNVAIPIKVKDKTINSVVQNIIFTKIESLDGLVEGLSTLLKSQEVFSQLQYTIETFKKQATACELWISSRRDALETNVHILDDDSLALKLDDLRDAVSRADSIQAAMLTHDNHFNLLNKSYQKYTEYFNQQKLLEETEKEDKIPEFDNLVEVYESISRQWNDLLVEAKEITQALTTALLPAELNFHIVNLITSFELLIKQIHSIETSSVTDSEISEWQKRIDFLEADEYNRLHSEVTEYKHNMSVEAAESLMSQLDYAGDILLEIRATLTNLYDEINSSRLCKTHIENSELFCNCARNSLTLIQEVRYDKFRVITNVKTAEKRAQRFRNLINTHKQIKDAVIECQGFYEDSSSYYSVIRLQSMESSKSEQAQHNVEKLWNELNSKLSDLSSFVTSTSKWIEACDELENIGSTFDAIKSDVDNISISHSSTITNSKIKKCEKQLMKASMLQEELENTVKTASDLSDDLDNKNEFLGQSQRIRQVGEAIQHSLDKKRTEKERMVLFELYKTEIAKVLKICEDQISYIRQQANTSPEYHLKKIGTINNIINVYSAALSHVQDNYNECKLKYDGIITNQITKLIKTFEHPHTDVEEQKETLESRMKELKLAMKTENDYITTLKLLGHVLKSEKEISKSITKLKATASSSYNGKKPSYRVTRARDLPELKEFMQRYEAIEISVQEFHQSCLSLRQKLNRNSSSTRSSAMIKAIDKRKDDMTKKWTEIKFSAEDTRKRLDLLHRRQIVCSKLEIASKFVDDLKDRVKALQLSGKSISLEEQELDEVQEEINSALKKNIDDIDELLKSINQKGIARALTTSNSETSLISQREKLASSIDVLYQLIAYRREQAHTEGSITEFFSIIDEIDDYVLQLSKVVEATSTQNANVVGSKFSKTDLQSLLKSLSTSYKKSECHIAHLLDKAKLESQKQFLDDNERVAKRLQKTLNDWSLVQTSVISREKELQTCIRELDHEFFTKLAMAKTQPKERKSRANNKSAVVTQTPFASGSRITSNFKSHTLSTEMKTTTHGQLASRRSKSPANTAASGQNESTYISDPKNELDVQLGLIVNKSPYLIKVKKVPGEVGKYWFGEEHPRLVYCRILPSKMVMVRVGGGWVELSKFMKDHGHSDGLVTKSNNGETQYLTVNTFIDPVNEAPAFSVTARSGSPTGPAIGIPIIRRGSGVSSSLTNRSSNSSSGYMEGDKFIQTDEEGNQFVHKMVKANSNPKPPSSNKKRSKYNRL